MLTDLTAESTRLAEYDHKQTELAQTLAATVVKNVSGAKFARVQEATAKEREEK